MFFLLSQLSKRPGLSCWMSQLGFCFCDKHYDKNLLKKERIYFLLYFQVLWLRGYDKNLAPIPWKNAANWFAAIFIFNCHSYTAQIYWSRDCISHDQMGPPTSVSDQENVSPTCPQANLRKAALQLSFPFPASVKLTNEISLLTEKNPQPWFVGVVSKEWLLFEVMWSSHSAHTDLELTV